MENHAVELVNINKTFGDNVVLDNINLYIRDKEFLTLLGPSGCGKTTTLRLIGGFETPTSGKILFEGKDISNVAPYERNINTVFQKYALFPNMNVYENIAFGLKIKKTPKDVIEQKVKEMLRLVNLKGFEKRSVQSLSGGQQQRIAIARALVNEPKVLLLDEPLGALDLQLRKDMQVELKNIQKRVGITFVYVTHDQEEALTMSDTIVVMNEGKIQQIGTPIDIYNEPKNAFIASFIGESNILDGIMNEDFVVSFSNRKFKCVDKGFEINEKIDVVIRPEDLELVDENSGMLVGVVKSEIFKGVHYELLVEVDGFDYMVHSTITKPVGSRVGLRVIPDNIHIMKKGVENK
ncbi:MAG: ABC transporter ATP-binding protein [Peptoniphilaceae bacterium]|uniref:spermidine/putrescine ABC transporter ATP-binding protein n=1 Tax=Parvimonas sp. TaxID=1944660 RepID=UPI0025D73C9C|nr:spermidine/putrescine ABC transporter ATP-binding protein [Parvimonas sp.]MCI5997277.1 ABC transporter ATP-binding protein [Parvimonas sp.]MDD7765449.1 ABC transporter ATP-binding protein [Peptoniphilaceae bacterium]MDY3050990.1 spermidine/putrescine ABC transporter ATP-binding protein [Parvimonas sp.]